MRQVTEDMPVSTSMQKSEAAMATVMVFVITPWSPYLQ
jgi:hypothetical protein